MESRSICSRNVGLVATDARNTEKRPVIAFAHGVPMGPVITMRTRISRIASVELAFLDRHDLAEKIAQVQFPGGAAKLL